MRSPLILEQTWLSMAVLKAGHQNEYKNKYAVH